MDNERIFNDELELQHFDFSSTQYIVEFKNLIDEDVEEIINQFKEKLYAEKEVDKEVVDKEFKKIHNKYMKVRDELILVIEPKIREFFAIPKSVASQLHWKQPYLTNSEESVEDLEREIIELERQCLKERTFQRFCEHELTCLKMLEPLQEQVGTLLDKDIYFKEVPLSDKTKKLLSTHDALFRDVAEDSEGALNVCPHYDKFN